jgi:hypothetical protein
MLAVMHGEAIPTGLCAECRHARPVVSGRGSTFLLCRRSESDPRYPRYPRLPVIACAGFERTASVLEPTPEPAP